MTQPKPKCTNCTRVRGKGGADGLCGRCYKHRSRHDELPPAELSMAGDKSARIVVRVDAPMLARLRREARGRGVALAKLVRSLLEDPTVM